MKNGPLRAAAVAALILLSAAAHAKVLDENDPAPSVKLGPVRMSIVNVAVGGAARTPADNPILQDPGLRPVYDVYGPALPPHPGGAEPSGSGVIVDARNGYVLTSTDIVRNADTIIVTLLDFGQFDATLVGIDAATHIAVLQIRAPDLIAAPFGDAAELEDRELLLAIGNPLGYGAAVAMITASPAADGSVTTEGKLAPASLGGALLDLNGRLIAVNTGITVAAGAARDALDRIVLARGTALVPGAAEER